VESVRANVRTVRKPAPQLLSGFMARKQVVAAAMARVGKRVLHLDALPFYGGSHATLPLSSFRDWLGL
jgi:RAB protein geranylgeranyltransferase component A